ncbi:MAG: hypothetical protein HQL93_11570, partial [Magnetococcales bacterium]|nr:hypothetical protein [Magnetococcales bacterium]
MSHKPRIESQDSLTERYARYRRMLCCVTPGLDGLLRSGAMHRTSFAWLSQQFDVILLDAYGVLNLGDQAILGAAQAVNALRLPYLVVSNNASQSPQGMVRRFSEMGFVMDVDHILSSGMAIAPYIAHSDYRDRPYFLVGSQESMTVYAPQPEKLMVNRLGSSQPLDEAEYILMCSNRDYYGQEQERGVNDLLQRKRVPGLAVVHHLMVLNGGRKKKKNG